MSVQNEITRIQNDRNTIRTKLNGFNLVELTASLDDCATAVYGIVDRGTPAAEVTEGSTYTIQRGYYHGGTVTGIAGGGSYQLQEKTTTPTKSQQVITPDAGKYGLSKVTVSPIPAAYQDVTSVTATANDVLSTKVFVDSTGASVAGTMTNNGSVSVTLNTMTTSYTVPSGYHSGSGTVSIVTESKTVTPSGSSQNITPTSGKVLSKVTVNSIPSNYVDSSTVDAVAANVLSGKKAVVTTGANTFAVASGTMTNNGAISGTITGLGSVAGDTSYTIPSGYTSGGTVGLTSDIETALAAI